MGRSTVYNRIVDPKVLKFCNEKNIELGKDFLDYLISLNRSKETIYQYNHDLNILWCWNYIYNADKFFAKISKRDFTKFQNHMITEWNWSACRIRRVKSTISSLSNYIENILDDEDDFKDYRNVISKIENPTRKLVRTKTVFEMEELQSLLDYLVKKKEFEKACALALAIYSGRRKAELPRFKISHFKDENIMFDGAMWKTDEEIKTKGQGGGKYMNLYVLREPFKPYLDMWVNYMHKHGLESEWLFPRKDMNGTFYPEEPVATGTLDAWAKQFSRILGKPFYWHSLRHFFTTFLIKNKIPQNVVQDIIGWESADMVNLYCDISADESIGQYFGKDGFKKSEHIDERDYYKDKQLRRKYNANS